MNLNEKRQRKRLEKAQANFRKEKEELKEMERGSNPFQKQNKGRQREEDESESLFSLLFSKKKERMSVQESIPYRRMFADGVCQVGKYRFSKTVRFYDINYQLSTKEDKQSIFHAFCGFLNYFDPSVDIQFTYLNQVGQNEELEKSITIPQREDGFGDIRKEYRKMLRSQSQKGNHGLTKKMYLTFSIKAKDRKEAQTRLERMEMEILNNFKIMGVKAQSLTGEERLKVLHQILRSKEPFTFSYEKMKRERNTTKEYISPKRLDFTAKDQFQVDRRTGEVRFLQILAPELSDRMLAEFLSVEENMLVTFHINAMDQTEAIKMVKRKITDLDKMKIEENKKAIRAGYDMDILPSDLITYGNDAKKLLAELQNHNERMFVVTILFLNMEQNRKKLRNILFQLTSIAGRHNCVLKPLNYRQEQGLMSCLPLGKNSIELERGMTSSSTAVFIPFTTEELCVGGESLYYGLNALSRNIIMADRKLLKNPNGLILGTPGSGKSFSAKREITNAFLVTDDDIIVCDPESEYGNLTMALGGEVIKISPTSKDYINPLDINVDYADEDNPLSLKSDFILSLFELVVGKEGLSAEETSVIDRCLPILYEKYFEDPVPENMPILEDLYHLLKRQEERVGKKLAVEMEIYVKGSLNVFNHRTNVDTTNRVLCYDIKELGKQLRKIGMLIVQDQVWNRVTINRNKKETRFYCDEFHLLLREAQTASYSIEIWKRFRKWGGMPTGLTQNVKDLLASPEIENIFDNTDFILMLNQAGGDREILAEKLNISLYQLSYVTNSAEGEGLLFYGNTIVPFVDRFPKDTKLYRLMTTKPEELKEREI